MRGSVLGSGVVHALLLAVLLTLRPSATIVVPGPDVVQVALVDAVAATVPPPAPPDVKKPEPRTELKPVEDPGVRLERERVKKKNQETRKEEERPRSEPRAAAGLPTTRLGPAGLRGDLSVDTGDFEFTYYLVLVRNKIASNWMPPAGLSTGGNPIRAVAYFKVGRGGELSGIRLESGSGIEFFDRSALRAVMLSDPLPPLPLGFPGGELGVHFGFEWESP